ncbi:MAG: hypothetical protein COB85_01105 [Bacteroidetes bacterium]|nr:MAG: hypothetical protein COB85_01105 [Bacteroidota bacterium]
MTRWIFYILTATFLLFGHKSNGQAAKDFTTDCNTFKTGIFKLVDYGVYTIVRSDNKQRENDALTGLISEMDIKWLTDCTYILFNRKVIKGVDKAPPKMNLDTFYNEIIHIDGNRYTVATTFKKLDFTAEAILVKVDSSSLFRDISDLPEFKEFNGTTRGGTLIDVNYSVAYRQKTEKKNEYLLAFEEVFTIDHRGSFLLLDTTTFQMKAKQYIATSDCRYDGKQDKEIVAIYASNNDNEEAKIIRAWRVNRKTLKIEGVEIGKVKYKVADNNLFYWNE